MTRRTMPARTSGHRSTPLSDAHRATLRELLGDHTANRLSILLRSGRETIEGAASGAFLMTHTRVRLESAIERVAKKLRAEASAP